MCILSIQNHLIGTCIVVLYIKLTHAVMTHILYYNKYSVVRHVHVHPIYTYNVHIQCMFLLWITCLILKLQLNSRK